VRNILEQFDAKCDDLMKAKLSADGTRESFGPIVEWVSAARIEVEWLHFSQAGRRPPCHSPGKYRVRRYAVLRKFGSGFLVWNG
jgi:hypothetical protein